MLIWLPLTCVCMFVFSVALYVWGVFGIQDQHVVAIIGMSVCGSFYECVKAQVSFLFFWKDPGPVACGSHFCVCY